MYIAFDFDGTCVTNKWPDTGEKLEGCVETLKLLATLGHKLILNTCREGLLLADAIRWCDKQKIPLYAVNDNPEARAKWGICRKVWADLYIDDHALGVPLRDGCVDWAKTKELIKEYLNNGKKDC